MTRSRSRGPRTTYSGGTMRQRALRLSLLAGGIVVAFLVLLAVQRDSDHPQTDGVEAKSKSESKSTAPLTRLTTPPAYNTAHGWEITSASPAYALAGSGTATRLAHLESAGQNRFRLRTLDPATGARGWEGAATRALFAPGLPRACCPSPAPTAARTS